MSTILSWLLVLLLLLASLALLLNKYVRRKFNYWKKRGIYNPEPLALFGNAIDMCFFKKGLGSLLKSIYDSTKEPLVGMFIFDEPYLVLRSPELIKQILVKDFQYFSDRNIAALNHNKVLQNFTFFQKNPKWKELRAKVTPIFTSGKLRGMFQLIDGVGKDLSQYIEKNLGILEAKELCALYTTNVSATCFFGINAHCFENKEAIFRKFSRKMFDFRWRNAVIQSIYFFRPGWVDLLGLNFVEQWVIDYFSDIVLYSMNQREVDNGKIHNLIGIMSDLKKNEEIGSDITNEVIVGQAIQFYIGGFETTSSTLSYTLYECAVNPHIQDKLRNEISCCLNEHGGITFDGLNAMKYLGMCISETLRKYPVLPFLDRRCNSDYHLTGTNLIIEKGMPIFIPLLGLHMDENFFPDPQKYDPERFSNKNEIPGSVYLPFGDGPRACLGERFAFITLKIAIVHILTKFRVERVPDTPDPVEFEPRSLFLASRTGIHIKFAHLDTIAN